VRPWLTGCLSELHLSVWIISHKLLLVKLILWRLRSAVRLVNRLQGPCLGGMARSSTLLISTEPISPHIHLFLLLFSIPSHVRLVISLNHPSMKARRLRLHRLHFTFKTAILYACFIPSIFVTRLCLFLLLDLLHFQLVILIFAI